MNDRLLLLEGLRELFLQHINILLIELLAYLVNGDQVMRAKHHIM